ncbi:hypothetical protein AVEN_250323-1 [Araneus ventricosus]|uniref:Integrase catalytic domain-containing protein n=1 Tax=Araneus ventricosus TaxID=182803 RepID=A0A4Y2FKF9_ARAVE|nr:hypothetical protein AVEN_250323-1 [Araneus ventricosus]
MDMPGPSFIRSFKIFVSRRGLCKIVYSDNAKTFLKTKKEFNILDKTLKSEECQHYFSEMRITWNANAPKGAWWDGFWERLVCSVKSSLKRILGKMSLNYLELKTVVIEVEDIINSHPLTYQDDEADSVLLTPAHFLIGRWMLSAPSVSALPPSTKSVITRRRKHQLNLVNYFWNRWCKNYLLEL